jgi:hypothetical protein
MLRLTQRALDHTKQPHKVYKYGYVTDPRKFVPIERVGQKELFPRVVRPPCAHVPDFEAFLDKCDVEARYPVSEMKASFSSWDDLMNGRKTAKSRGVPYKAMTYLRMQADLYRNGVLPQRFDRKAEQKYWKQFDRKDKTQSRIPHMPEKYRPHQLGVDERPLPDYAAMNRMPEWAQKEEARLADKKAAAAAQ